LHAGQRRRGYRRLVSTTIARSSEHTKKTLIGYEAGIKKDTIMKKAGASGKQVGSKSNDKDFGGKICEVGPLRHLALPGAAYSPTARR